jgi:hypothetical protein
MITKKALSHLYFIITIARSRYSSVCIATGYGLDGRGSIPGGGKSFLFSAASSLALGSTLHLIQWVPGAISPGLKRPGCEADHSPPSSAVRNGGAITPLPYMSSWHGA